MRACLQLTTHRQASSPSLRSTLVYREPLQGSAPLRHRLRHTSVAASRRSLPRHRSRPSSPRLQAVPTQSLRRLPAPKSSALPKRPERLLTIMLRVFSECPQNNLHKAHRPSVAHLHSRFVFDVGKMNALPSRGEPPKQPPTSTTLHAPPPASRQATVPVTVKHCQLTVRRQILQIDQKKSLGSHAMSFTTEFQQLKTFLHLFHKV